MLACLATVAYCVFWPYDPEPAPAEVTVRPEPRPAAVSRGALGVPVLGNDQPGEAQILLSTFVGGAVFRCAHDGPVDLIAAHVRNLDRHPGTVAFALYETEQHRLVAATEPGGLPVGYEGWAALPVEAHLRKGREYLLVAAAPGGGMVFCSARAGGRGCRAGLAWDELRPPRLEPPETENAVPAIFCARRPAQADPAAGPVLAEAGPADGGRSG